VFQTDWFSGVSGRGLREGDGTMDRDGFLPSRPRYNIMTTYGWEIGDEALEESRVLHRGRWAIGGGVRYWCIMSVLRRSSQCGRGLIYI